MKYQTPHRLILGILDALYECPDSVGNEIYYRSRIFEGEGTRRFYHLLALLRFDGLIERNRRGGNSLKFVYRLTERGLRCRELLSEYVPALRIGNQKVTVKEER